MSVFLTVHLSWSQVREKGFVVALCCCILHFRTKRLIPTPAVCLFIYRSVLCHRFPVGFLDTGEKSQNMGRINASLQHRR